MPSSVCIKGMLTNEGVECQAFRSDTGELYTLVGDLSGFSNGDEVVVCGTVADVSFCMQETTINLSWIGRVPKKESLIAAVSSGGDEPMLNDEQATKIVVDCIRSVSHVDSVDTTGSLDDAEISDDQRVDDVIDLIVNDGTVGVPSTGHTINDSEFENVDSDTIVNDLINTVRNKSA